MEKHKVLFGCGGCGCLFALVAFAAGLFMLAMWGDSHMSELGPFGAIVTPLAILIGLVAGGFLVAGHLERKKSD